MPEKPPVGSGSVERYINARDKAVEEIIRLKKTKRPLTKSEATKLLDSALRTAVKKIEEFEKHFQPTPSKVGGKLAEQAAERKERLSTDMKRIVGINTLLDRFALSRDVAKELIEGLLEKD